MTAKAAPPDPVLASLQKLSDGLLFPSEDDHPVLPYTLAYEGAAAPTGPALLAAIGKPPTTTVEVDEGLGFFDDVTANQSWFTGDEREKADRFRALVAVLKSLQAPRVYRVGKGDVDVFALGRSPKGAWVGIKTAVVET